MTLPLTVAEILVLVLSYLIGSIPVGWIIVKIGTGRDIRRIESGRTGGTNAMRAAGVVAGLLTALGDALKGFAPFWLIPWLIPVDTPMRVWIQVAAPLLAIMGHNYSIFLLEKRSDGRLQLRGGAGGAPCLGGSASLWPWSAVFILPIGVLVFLLIGYASVTTLSVALISVGVFTYLAIVHQTPWQFILYGVLSFLIVGWALRPNLVRLINGNERVVGLRAWLRKRKLRKQAENNPKSSA